MLEKQRHIVSSLRGKPFPAALKANCAGLRSGSAFLMKRGE
jgi:hypothetical protein